VLPGLSFGRLNGFESRIPLSFPSPTSSLTPLPTPWPSRGPPQQVVRFDQSLDDHLFDIGFDAHARSERRGSTPLDPIRPFRSYRLMTWYDVVSPLYDASLEKLYAQARRRAADALDLRDGLTVLDVPCGTGLSFDAIVPAIRPGGAVLGVDQSRGMLARAQQRVQQRGFSPEVSLCAANAHALDGDLLERSIGTRQVDRLHIFLGMTVFTSHESAFEQLWSLLAPGGLAVVVDVHAAGPSLHGRIAKWIARADIQRRTWEPLQRLAEHFERIELPPDRGYGGELWLATGRKRVSSA
jgi:ubiquinone/menaquinone biosynthesis C-methylase UbiE